VAVDIVNEAWDGAGADQHSREGPKLTVRDTETEPNEELRPDISPCSLTTLVRLPSPTG